MAEPRERKGSTEPFFAYCYQHIKNTGLSRWIVGFMDEIARSRVNQVSLVLGAMGISGVVVASFRYLFENPIVPLFAVATGLLVLIILAAHSWAKNRRMEQPADNTHLEKHLTELLQLFQEERRAMLRPEIAAKLNLTTEEINQLLVLALSEEWIEQVGQTFFRLREEMKALAYRRIKKQQQENHDA